MEYPLGSFRAYCNRVVDGDTFDLHVDVGFHTAINTRFRLLGYDTPELRSHDPVERALALSAKDFVDAAIGPVPESGWNLRIETKKDPDGFGRWLCRVFYTVDGLGEMCLGDVLHANGWRE